MHGTPTALCHSQPQLPLIFTTKSHGGLLFLVLEPLVGRPGLGMGLLTQGTPLQLRNTSGILKPPHVGVGPAYLHLHPPYQPLCASSLYP